MEHTVRTERREPAASIIRKLGGEAVVSEATETSYTAPYRWQQPKEKGGTGGIIPHWHHPTLLTLAKERGVDLAPADFLPAPASTEAA